MATMIAVTASTQEDQHRTIAVNDSTRCSACCSAYRTLSNGPLGILPPFFLSFNGSSDLLTVSPSAMSFLLSSPLTVVVLAAVLLCHWPVTLCLQFEVYNDSACTVAIPSLSLLLPSVNYTSSTTTACSSGTATNSSISAQCSPYSAVSSNSSVKFVAQQYNVSGCPQGALQRSSIQWSLSFPLSAGLAGPTNRCTPLYYLNESTDQSSTLYGVVQCSNSSSNAAAPNWSGGRGAPEYTATVLATALLLISHWALA